ncbi:hypothetical protein JVT61DRAFT_12302 [Boletus reticuloceps]|uniref:Uncharacterized protein n=1 Tax=Boletus reticuloceps TaxID=495285 RepID=A0A8I2YE24_9AGAM|nr:hypothetical protein JVT61DRAFT_12302 [Boletus reticuloceps]
MNHERLNCRLVDPMCDPRDGIVYEASEEFKVVFDLPVRCDVYAYGYPEIKSRTTRARSPIPTSCAPSNPPTWLRKQDPP